MKTSLNPRRTFGAVVGELAYGLGNGTIVLSERDGESEADNALALRQPSSEVGESSVQCEVAPYASIKSEEAVQPSLDIGSVREKTPTIELIVIGKGAHIRGEISGSESLHVEGKIEGVINLAGRDVTIGRNGQVAANIYARNIVVIGRVRGNVTASDHVLIRSDGSLTGDVTAQRISIEDGAFFKGGIDIRKPELSRSGAKSFNEPSPRVFAETSKMS